MGNCLITKLNGTVDNGDLRKFGEFRVTFINDASYLRFLCSKLDLKVVGDGLFTYVDVNGNRTEHLNQFHHHQGGWGNIYPEGSPTSSPITISFVSKYSLNVLIMNVVEANISDYVIGTISRFEYMSSKSSEIISAEQISKNMPNLETLSLISTNCVYGNVADFYKLNNIVSLTLGTNNSLYGDLLTLSIRQILNGRETASISSAWNGNFTFNGEQIPNTNNNILSWEKSGNNYVVTMNAGPDFVRTVTVDPNGSIVQ